MSRRAEGERIHALGASEPEPWTWRDVARTGVTVLIAAIAVALATVAGATGTGGASAGAAASAPTPTLAIVVRDQTVLRAAPHASAQQQALLWQGEVLEVRGERIDHLQVWDHQRERGGFVDAGRVRRTALAEAEAPELLGVLRFVRGTPGSEALGIGIAAAYLRAAPAEALRGAAGAEAFDAIGTMADRLAQRASTGAASAALINSGPASTSSSRETATVAHLEVVQRHGVAFRSFERHGAMRICSDGEAFRRVLAMPAADAVQRARAALALTRSECIDPALAVAERQRLDVWRADVLDRVDRVALPPLWKNRIAMRRASVWSALAFQHARRGVPAAAQSAARRALSELADVARGELADEDFGAWNEAAIRVGASRWAAIPAAVQVATRNVRIVATPGDPGQTCVALIESGKSDAGLPLVKRCTYGVVWSASATVNREGNALALAVQPMEAWRELWLFTRQGRDWSLQVLPPATASPELGYAEFAGWVPGGRKALVARESRGPKGLKRNFEVVRLDTLGTERQAGDPSVLGAVHALAGRGLEAGDGEHALTMPSGLLRTADPDPR